MPSGTHAPTTAGSSPGAATPTISGNRRVSALYEISKLLSASQELHDTMREVLTVLATYIDLHRPTIALHDRRGAFYVAVSTDQRVEAGRGAADAYPLEAAEDVLRANMPAVMAVTPEDSRFARYCGHIRSRVERDATFLCVPLRLGDRPVGTISAERTADAEVRAPIDEDLRFLRMSGNLIGQSLRLHGLPERSGAGDSQLNEACDTAPGRSRRRGALAAQPAEFDDIVAQSPAMAAVLDQVRHVARTRAPVMVRGESGTGKEVIAHRIHRLSPRRDKPFVCVNCAALPENLLESELFGHEKGAFTGANSERKGRFEAAHGGTLLLDEIGDVSHTFQTKLLRVLQEGQFERLGSSRTRTVDVRIIAATNRNLEQAVVDGDFRADLYYRINVISLVVPPLRQRTEDIGPLARQFLERFNQENGDNLELGDDAVRALETCPYPGNVRELENCITRLATMACGARIQRGDFPCGTTGCLASALWQRQSEAVGATAGVEAREGLSVGDGPQRSANAPEPAPAGDPGGNDRLIERENLVAAMEKAGWVQAKAARLLGMTPRQVRYALYKHGIEMKRL